MYKKAIGLDGIEYDSGQECKISDWLFIRGINYEPHKKLPKPSRQKCDFYLPDHNLWLEWDGLMGVRALSSDHADARASKKVEFYKKHNMKYLVLNREYDWEQELYLALLG